MNMILKQFAKYHFIQNIFLVLLISMLAIFSYWGIHTHEFINFDDDIYVKTNHYIKNGITLENIKWAFTFNGESYWHPVTWLSLMLDCEIFGLKSGSLLVENLALHIVNALLLFTILLKLTGERFKAGMVALFFAIHPIQVESVAWLVERKTVLSSFFLFLAFYAYLIFIQKRKYVLLALSSFFYAIGLMAKPIIMIFPFILMIVDYWPLNRLEKTGIIDCRDRHFATSVLWKWLSFLKLNIKVLLAEKLPFILLTAVSLVVSMMSVHQHAMVINYNSIPVHFRLFNFFVSILEYLRSLVWPVDLSIFYPFPQMIPTWKFLLALILTVTVSIIFYQSRKKHPWLIVGWCWFIIALMPTSGIIQSGLWPAHANRFMYLPIIGILILLVWELDERIKGEYANVLKIILCIALTVYFSLMTRVQNVYFTNSYSLFHRSLEVVPDNALGLNNISVHLINLGRHKEAMTYLERGMKAFPTKPSYYQNYGICLVANGDEEGAIKHFKKAITLDSKLHGAYLNLGLINSHKGHDDEALQLISKAMEINPDNASLHHHYGNLLTKMGRHAEALPHLQYAAKKDHGDLKIRLNLAQSYQFTGRLDQAMAEYQFLDREMKHNKGYVYYGMAGIYSQKRIYDQCIDYLRKAQESDFAVTQFLKSDTRFDNFRRSEYYDQFVKLNKDKNKGR